MSPPRRVFGKRKREANQNACPLLHRKAWRRSTGPILNARVCPQRPSTAAYFSSRNSAGPVVTIR